MNEEEDEYMNQPPEDIEENGDNENGDIELLEDNENGDNENENEDNENENGDTENDVIIENSSVPTSLSPSIPVVPPVSSTSIAKHKIGPIIEQISDSATHETAIHDNDESDDEEKKAILAEENIIQLQESEKVRKFINIIIFLNS